jgi:hypothetical protein
VVEPEVHPESTVHELDAPEDADARAWRARMRDSVPNAGATIIDLTQRHRDRIAGRWGKPIEEPAPDPSPEPGQPLRLIDGLNQVHYWRDQPPSLRAIWADMREGGADVHRDFGSLAFAAYWAVGVPSFAWVSGCRIAESPAHRPGRAAGALVLLLLLWAALAIAGLNPISLPDLLSALNPF